MDALSSQALVAGYRAALVAADRLPRFFPLFMTAAGTVPPAKVLVLGAGVAGLQAIATASGSARSSRRTTCAPPSADEVRSMGAKFVELDLEALEGAGGYAREMSRRPRRAPARAARAVRRRVRRRHHDGGGPRPPGAAARHPRDGRGDASRARSSSTSPRRSGGNCRGRRGAGEEVVHRRGHGLGRRATCPSQMPVDASRLYARNVRQPAAADDHATATVAPDWEDEIVAGCWVTREGAVREGIDGVTASIGLLTIFVLSVFVGFEVVSKVSTILHTPLMSGANAIHGVILVGAILVTGHGRRRASQLTLGLVAVVLATVNMVGGFVVTDRMLEMFKGRKPSEGGDRGADASDDLGRPRLPRRGGLLHPRAQGTVVAARPRATAT